VSQVPLVRSNVMIGGQMISESPHGIVDFHFRDAA